MTVDVEVNAEREKQRAAGSSVVAAVLLTVLKLVVGLLTGSLGILSEAAHSGLDLVAALVTFFAVRVSDKPPDDRHLYGHGKVENLSALIETLLLLATCGWIIYEVIQRLFFESVKVNASVWAFAVMVTSIVVDVSRSRVLYRAARKYNSQALEADALHFSTDVWSSLTVIAGLTLVWLSDHLGSKWAWLAKADAVAAFVVALIVIYVSLQLGRRAVSVLLDAAPPGLAYQIRATVAVLPGVQSVGPVRVRQSGASTFVDLTVGVARNAPLETAHEIATLVEEQVVALTPKSDVVVHVDPVSHADEHLPQTVNAIAARFGLHTHKIRAHEVRGDVYVSLDVEVSEELTLEEAHRQVSDLETALYTELPYIREIITHIEPLTTSPAPNVRRAALEQKQLREKILSLVESAPRLNSCHNLHIWAGREGYDVILHCRADPDLSVAEAHLLSEQLKKQIQGDLPRISQVLVHVEPEKRR